MQIDLNADIVPAQGLSGFRVGVSLRELSTFLAALHLRQQIVYELATLFEAQYQVGSGVVEIVVDVRNGKIARLTAYEGYRGALFGSIRPGMTAGSVMKLEPRLYYDEAESLILCRSVDGVALDIAESDPDPEQVPRLKISAISVFAPELSSAAGQRGDW